MMVLNVFPHFLFLCDFFFSPVSQSLTLWMVIRTGRKWRKIGGNPGRKRPKWEYFLVWRRYMKQFMYIKFKKWRREYERLVDQGNSKLFLYIKDTYGLSNDEWEYGNYKNGVNQLSTQHNIYKELNRLNTTSTDSAK